MKLMIEYTYQDGSKVGVGYRECDELTVLLAQDDLKKVASMRITQRDAVLNEPEMVKGVLARPIIVRAAEVIQEEKKPSILDINKMFR